MNYPGTNDRMPDYDSAADTLRHIMQVRDLLGFVAAELIARGAVHDHTKLAEPEKSVFDRVTPMLKELVYGSDAYKASLREMGPALRHHYDHNSHHPEHYPNGIAGMDLFDVVEMACDWVAAARRMASSDGASPTVVMEINVKRFGIEPQLAAIIERTVRRLEVA